ncbi:MAG: 3-oxoacyl-ACP reductase FabG [Dehalococcoidales bacterium]|nr:3-oxoacyl-ACP reductase FabG [Dehalococcoidales bacterium]
MRLANKVALVTGASRGIGKAIALAYACEGADVAVNYLHSMKEAEEVAASARKMGRRSIAVKADVGNKSDIDHMVAAVMKEFGRIDILVNNAGVGMVAPSAMLEESAWRRGIDVLLTGVFLCSQAVGREMIKQKSGKIVNISSVVGLGGMPERAAYGSAKAGVINLTKVLGCEWANHHINVNAICPGFVRTDLVTELMSRGLYNEKELLKLVPLGRLGEPEDVASVAVFLASEESSYITGQAISVDGGWLAYSYLESWLETAKERA